MSAIVIRDQREPGWFHIDNEIIDRYGVKLGACGVSVYALLCRRCTNSTQQVRNLSRRDIGAILGISQDRVRKSLNDLADLGLIHVDIPDRPSPGIISTITLLKVKTTERVAFGSGPELNVWRSPYKEEKTKTETKPLPPTPLEEGGISTIWQSVCEQLKDDLSDAFVKTPHFEECAYDQYFRDAWLVEIKNNFATLDSARPDLLREGVEKFQKRLRETFRRIVYEVHAVRVRGCIADSASQSTESCSLPFEKSAPVNVA